MSLKYEPSSEPQETVRRAETASAEAKSRDISRAASQVAILRTTTSQKCEAVRRNVKRATPSSQERDARAAAPTPRPSREVSQVPPAPTKTLEPFLGVRKAGP